MVNKNSILVVLFLLASLLAIFLVLSPAEAFLLNLSISKPNVDLGDSITFIARILLEANELLNIDYLIINLEGPTNLSCKFTDQADLVDGCEGFSIERIEVQNEDPNGYGSGLSMLIYNTTLDTSIVLPGTYKLRVNAILEDGNVVFSPIRNIRVLADSNRTLESCSIRAKAGNAFFNQTSLGSKNKLNLYVSNKDAVDGEGTISIQNRNKKVSYNFKVTDAFRLDSRTIVFHTEGSIKINRDSPYIASATGLFDTQTMEVTFNSEEFRVENMNVNFARC